MLVLAIKFSGRINMANVSYQSLKLLMNLGIAAAAAVGLDLPATIVQGDDPWDIARQLRRM